MHRADRLFQLVQLLRGRRASTAAYLAQRLQVSMRTVYRDVADLQAQGVPIEGEAGIGYRLGAGFDLPPMMFSKDEARALVASVRLAQAWLDPALARYAQDALGKIVSVLPADARAAAEALAVFAPMAGLEPMAQQTLNALQTLREAAQTRSKLLLAYRDKAGAASERSVRPLGCFYWGSVWTLAAWCETKGDFRSFRVDRIASITVLEERFKDEPGKALADLLRREQAQRLLQNK